MPLKVARTDIDMIRFSAALRAKRGNRSLREVAAELGMNHSRFGDYETSACRPGLTHFLTLCTWMGVDADYFTITTNEQVPDETAPVA